MKLFKYSELSPAAQVVARSAVIEHQRYYYNAEKRAAKLMNIHGCVNINWRITNRPNRFIKLSRKLALIKKFESFSDIQFNKLMAENICMFNNAGGYYVYSEDKFYYGRK
ncbi:hypothetical protein JT321_gp53 [Providencia phage Kokobel1]|uniref:Uncharacterized protein n=1 Tax=Providencia phage Kokobel1 TaxID=2783540 RepID=A0A873WG50_9CAUD|nr:hypothetical protein JT321_gp53 [Providencia phage Kokobel1]QPB11480.1 hypothetical protein [Providencia phage Kokobel1]